MFYNSNCIFGTSITHILVCLNLFVNSEDLSSFTVESVTNAGNEADVTLNSTLSTFTTDNAAATLNYDNNIFVSKNGSRIPNVHDFISDEYNVVGSRPVNISDFPYTAQLKLRDIDPVAPIVYCAGTIIGIRWVLGSAACNVDESLMSVYVGSDQLFEGEEYAVAKIFVMPVDGDTYPRIMLVKLDALLVYTSTISPIWIGGNRTRDKMLDGVIGNVTGFGDVFESSTVTYSRTLRQMELSILTFGTCVRDHEEYEPFTGSADFCATYPKGESNEIGICYGNRGVPFVVNNVLVGIATVIRRCGKNNIPSVFASVPIASDWICGITNICPYFYEHYDS